MNKFIIDEFNINKNYLIEASAGTGKTFNIIKMIEKYLTKYDISDLLIVTYTEKAVGELKSRIKKDINGVDICKANISTIHSFCQDILDKHYNLMNLPSELKMLDSATKNSMIDKFFYDLLCRNEIDLSMYDKKEKIVKITEKIYLNKDYEIDEDVLNVKNNNEFDIFILDMLNLKNKSKEEVIEYFKNIDKKFKNDDFKKLKEEICNLLISPLKSTKGVDFLDHLICEYVIVEGKFNYDGRKFKLKDYTKIKEFKNKEIEDEISSYENISIELYKYLQKEKIKHNYIEFDDMIRYVREGIISNNKLLDAIKNDYKVAIIDEFQDTNRLQWDIFKNIFLSENHNIVVVGDPKQSIYSFQGADIFAYCLAKKQIEENGGLIMNLDTNFRSTSSMINGYNKLFSLDSFNFNLDQKEDFEKITYNPVLVGKKEINQKINDKPINGINIITNNSKEPIATINYVKFIAKRVIEMCDKNNPETSLLISDKMGNYRPVSFKDIMILGRKRDDFNSYKNEFKKLGIPYVIVKDKGLFDSRECANWVALINAILMPDFIGNNRNAFRKALFTDFFKYSLKEISSPYYDRDDIEEIELFIEWKTLNQERKYNELIDSIFTKSKLETNLSNLTDLQSLNNFKQIGDYILTSLLKGVSLYELKNHLENNDIDDVESQKLSDLDAVEFMTIHGSKGLERPVVICVSEFMYQSDNNKNIGIYNFDGKRYLSLDIKNHINLTNEEITRLFYVCYTRASNLLIIPYFNDAREDCKVSAIKNIIDEDLDSIDVTLANLDDYNIFDLRKKVKNIFKKELNEDSSFDQLKVLKSINNKMILHNAYKHSYASMSKALIDNEIYDDKLNINKEGNETESIGFDESAHTVNLIYKDFNYLEIPQDYPRGSLIGTTLHEVFENFKFSDIDKSNNLLDVIKDRFKANLLPIKETHLDYTKNVVTNTLNALLPLIKGNKIDINNSFKLKDLNSDKIKAEVEFNFKDLTNKGVLNYCNGFIDLVFEKDGYFSILDWKSDTINDYDLFSYNNLSDLKQRVDSHYSIQRVLYSYCLIKWLSNLGYGTLEEVFNNHFGGIYYVFIRGCINDTSNGIYAQTWNNFKDLEDEYIKIMKNIKKSGSDLIE